MIPMICTVCNTLEPIQMLLNTTACQRCGGRMEFTQQHGHFMTEDERREIRRPPTHNPHHTNSTRLGDITGEPQNNGFYGMPDRSDDERPYHSGLGGDSDDDYDPDVGF